MSTFHTTPLMPGVSAVGNARSTARRIRVWRERGILGLLIACAALTLCVTLTILFVLGTESYRFFSLEEVSLREFLTGTQWNPLLGAERHFGVWPLVCGTLLVTGVAMSLALPLGLITAVWLSEYAPPVLRSIIKPVLEVLAGIPTVVFGFFALTVITPGLRWLHEGFGIYNAASAGLAVGIMCLPIVCSLSEDALRAVPRSLREAAYGLGSTRFEVSMQVVIPAALSGIVASFLLAIARAVGETMIVALAAGSLPQMSLDPRGQVQPITGYMVQVFLGDTSNFGPEYYSSYAVATVLFLLTFLLTVVGHRVRMRYRQVYE